MTAFQLPIRPPFQAPIATSETMPFPAGFLAAMPENNDDLSAEITRLAGHIISTRWNSENRALIFPIFYIHNR